jgi:hypothetical protein
MANSRSAPSKPRKKTGSSSSGGAAPSPKRASSRSTRAPSRPKPGEIDAGIVKRAAAKAKGPAVAVGAAAAGVAGARALKGRMGHKTVLGVPVPGWLGGASLPDLDVKSLAKTIGEASQRFAETSRAVSKDIERAGDQAERIARMLR